MPKIKQDKYNAVWLSHSSVSDFLKCPRLYYLRNIWKNENGRKVNIVSPHMSLGSAVHNVLEPLANVKTEERLGQDLMAEFDRVWEKYTGKMGGFLDSNTEKEFKKRGEAMIKNVIENPGPLKNKTIKFYQGDFIPNIYLSEKENVILCGLVDWVEYIEKNDTLRVIDFKTGKNDEKEESFQLPIYKILVEALQKRKVNSGAYWYLDRDKFPKNIDLIDEDMEEVKTKLLEVGLDIKKRKESAKTKKDIEKFFECKYPDTCFACREMELIKNYKENNDEIEYLGTGGYNQDLYLIKK